MFGERGRDLLAEGLDVEEQGQIYHEFLHVDLEIEFVVGGLDAEGQ